MNSPPLGGMPLSKFLSEYWQKQPLLIRQAIPNVFSPIDANTLAGLACEEGIESRLIIHDQTSDEWRLQHGPLEQQGFAELPDRDWTLLVQAVDHWFPQATEFLQLFNFIPQWRIDDLMMSYATDGGGVGPHFDNYDVFLVQTNGQRRWELGELCDENTPLRANVPLNMLNEFKAQHSWLLEPGDMLYLPPGYAHNGIAQGDDCITCSVGFRAPSHAEILQDYTDYLAERLTEAMRYTDTDLIAQKHPGEISAPALTKIRDILQHYAADESNIREWFGRYITRPKYLSEQANYDENDLDDVRIQLQKHLADGGLLGRNESSRFAFQAQEPLHQLFIDGIAYHQYAASNELIESLCKNTSFNNETLSLTKNNLDLLIVLLVRGALYLYEPE